MIPASTPALLIFLISHLQLTAAAPYGSWSLLQPDIGISAMHMQLLHNDRIIVFDRTDFGPSNLSLLAGNCREDRNDQALQHDCTAHSVEYDITTNSFRPLTIHTDTWCSSATVSPHGSLIQTGGFNDGERAVRILPARHNPSADCDWSENPIGLAVRRWYATNAVLPDGSAIIVGGRRQFSYEFYPKDSNAGVYILPFLSQTKDAEENNLYPFVYLNVDGNLFIFANNRAILFDYRNDKVVRTYPTLPGSDPRNYPSSGSSVLLPLSPSGVEAEVLVCGGAPKGSYTLASKNATYVKALSTCGRIKITDSSPTWQMETMPVGRVMGDMVLLPTGADVLIINGAEAGTAGWELGRSPVLSPIVYLPKESRFVVQSPSSIPRLYHSTAVLLRDGRVLVGGSNPHIYYNFSGVQYPTELSLEAFSPEYLGVEFGGLRPEIVTDGSKSLELIYAKEFVLGFNVSVLRREDVRVTMVMPGFSTHSFSMNQRLLILGSKMATGTSNWKSSYAVVAAAPASAAVAPPGYYMVFVVNGGVPSGGVWAHIQ
ncbi:aldehyde oxidase GLOX-like [Phalaenopsis equestris]|uniref:aldehyde oxidase GLOX-like n=1 Tax=Phalaenopsis equestris TaxID=78828 RepID=UPI0009E42FEA|nr:aldehyde oxidase GLOX-like [Phalaenopsis equestris]